MAKSYLYVPACAVGLMFFLGCGGSGGGSGSSGSGTPLTGKSVARAAAISGNQGQASGNSYFLRMVADTAPSGSKVGVFARALGIAHTRASSLQFDSTLNLYYRMVTTGNSLVLDYFTDSAGTHSAGSLTGTLQGASTYSTSYVSYPATIAIAANITGGSIPCTGTGSISVLDSAGDNKLAGNLTLASSGTKLSISMTMDSAGTVTGTVAVAQDGMTATMSDISGSISADITGPVLVTPQGYRGTGDLNLGNGTFQLSLTLPNGLTSNATVNAAQELQITYSDGSTLTVDGALTANPEGPSTTSTGTTSSTSGGTGTTSTTAGGTGTTSGSTGYTYGTPTYMGANGSVIAAAAPAGKYVGYLLSNSYPTSDYWGAPGAATTTVSSGSYDYCNLLGVSNTGACVGWGALSSFEGYIPLYFSSGSLAPTRLPLPANYPATASGGWAQGINSKGQIVGFLDWGSSNGGIVATYWASPTSTPVKMKNATGADASDLTGLYITDNGYVLGSHYYYTQEGQQFFAWTSPTASAVPLTDTKGNPQALTCSMALDGTVIGNMANSGGPLVWKAPGYKAVALPTTNTGPDGYWFAAGINSKDQIIGTQGPFNIAYWSSPTSKPTSTSSSFAYTAQYITDTGVIIGQDSDGKAAYYVLTPK